MTPSWIAARIGLAAANMFDGRRRSASRTPFAQHTVLRPHDESTTWGATHYGVFIPDLPAPYRYLNTMTLIGATGAELFDQDHLVADDARRTTTVLSSTAHADQHFYRAYDAASQCRFAPDGSSLQWGEELTITIDLPRVTVRGRYPGLDVDLRLDVTDVASYFVKTPIYDHFSLAATYSGTVDGVEVSGLGTVEYARIAAMAQRFTPRPVPARWKLPLDFFTYQIIDVTPDVQLLLTDVRAREALACRLLHVRTVRDGGIGEVFDAHFEVTEWGTATDDLGREMAVPRRFTWRADDAGAPMLQIVGTVDSPWRSGHGRGFVAAYNYEGSFRGDHIAGSAYIEWIDVRPER